eukprot:GILK01006672.1.p1 GENE.GILK01006672.1~~GILK01006672.1.p1  ORF type:complete len:819 (-),score=180.26 GILK01006672.1:33-2489(-)
MDIVANELHQAAHSEGRNLEKKSSFENIEQLSPNRTPANDRQELLISVDKTFMAVDVVMATSEAVKVKHSHNEKLLAIVRATETTCKLLKVHVSAMQQAISDPLAFTGSEFFFEASPPPLGPLAVNGSNDSNGPPVLTRRPTLVLKASDSNNLIDLSSPMSLNVFEHVSLHTSSDNPADTRSDSTTVSITKDPVNYPVNHPPLLNMDQFRPNQSDLSTAATSTVAQPVTLSSPVQQQQQQARERLLCNVTAVNMVMPFVVRSLQRLHEQLLHIEKKRKAGRTSIGLLKVHRSKLEALAELLPLAQTAPDDRLFLNEEYMTAEWEKLKTVHTTETFDDPARLEKNINTFMQSVAFANAFVSAGFKYKNKFLRTVGMAMGVLYYGVNHKKARVKGDIAYAEPNLEFARTVWNLPESKLIKGFYGMAIPKIAVDEPIVIPRSQCQFNSTLNPNQIDIRVDPASISATDLRRSVPVNASMPERDANKLYEHGVTYNNNDGEPNQQNETEMDDPNGWEIGPDIEARIICSRPLPRRAVETLRKASPPLWLRCFPCFADSPSEARTVAFPTEQDQIYLGFNCLIIHFHGGGFISMSSYTHQNYTRRWANALGVPILSVDYRLAPDHPYPKPFEDCWDAYTWAIQNMERQYGIRPRKVVLVGDSAGGNLAAAVTVKAIRENFRVPDGIVLAYPALNLTKAFSPSLLLALDDPIVPYTFLECCLAAYLGPNADPTTDPYLSPAIAPDDILSKFPPTSIMVGSKDPLHDDCVRFTHRLQNLNRQVRLKVYEGMPHGFLSYDAPVIGVHESRGPVLAAAEWLREHLSS